MTGTSTTTDELSTADEIAAKLKLRPSTITEWARRGVIPSERLTAKVVRFRMSDVLASLKKSGPVSRDAEAAR